MTVDDQLVVDSQAIIIDVFKGFREELLTVFGDIEHTDKADHSQLTTYDVKVEETLKEKLAQDFPALGFEGEENGASGNRNTYWLVDPIDSTRSFIRGLPFTTNMAALVHNGVVIVAIIYDFVNDILFTAQKGKGAFKNGKQIHINTSRTEGDLMIYSMTRQNFGRIQEALDELKMRAILPIGASGNTYTLLAQGKIDGIVNFRFNNKTLHDNAPGVLLCEEAGAVMLPYDDKTGVYRSQFIIGTPLVVDLIEKSGLI